MLSKRLGRRILAKLRKQTRAPVFDRELAEADLYAPRCDWSSSTGGELNISSFLFRDVNRKGIYDVHARPLDNVAVRMTAPDGRSVIRWSNSNGFANFSMSARDEKADISEGGNYRFDVLVPDGWIVTTDNVSQVKRLELFPGSVAGIVCTPAFFPVGLAQTLSIRGSIPSPEGIRELFVRSPSGTREKIELDSRGQFLVAAAPGRWELELLDHAQQRGTHRFVEVSQAPVLVSGHWAHEWEPLSTDVSVVDFESITQKNIKEIPNGVGGLNWWNFVALACAPGYTNNAISGNYVAYNSSGHPCQISSPKPFDFVGGYFGIAWKTAHGDTLLLRGWKSGELVYEDRITLSYLGPVWFDAEYRHIDRLDIATEHYWQVVMDDLAFRVMP